MQVLSTCVKCQTSYITGRSEIFLFSEKKNPQKQQPLSFKSHHSYIVSE